jgi:hypothetical protein
MEDDRASNDSPPKQPDDQPGELSDPGPEPGPDQGADPQEFPPLPPNRDEGTRA